ncbi:MAG: hypothetical protein PHR25_06460 [Clostridia bacterium]|nr:hypothetical protein [Clostridia bacterium]
METENSKVYFSDYFEISHDTIENYGALDIALVCDNPAFVDPFLIFANPKYKDQHAFIIKYLEFLRDKAISDSDKGWSNGDFKHYYKFSEVKQAWLGYSIDGNAGLGLGVHFAKSLYDNLNKIFANFGNEKITASAHLEKLCLVEEGVGIDKISDFTLNLIKSYILEYTQKFALKYIDKKFIKEFPIKKTSFNFDTGLWEDGRLKLPFLKHKNVEDFVLLIPQDILTRKETWISKNDFLKNNNKIFYSVDNEELRTKLNKYFYDNLLLKLNKERRFVKDNSQKSKKVAILKTLQEYPEILDYYIKSKEKETNIALKTHIADPEKVNFYFDTDQIQTNFRDKTFSKILSINDCIDRIRFFKQVIESNSKTLEIKGTRVQEKQLQIMFKMTTFGSLFDYNSEVNNGRGPIDFIISMGSIDKIGLELKLASSTKLKQNLKNQGDVYQIDSNLKHVIKVIFFFTDEELERVKKILNELEKEVDNYEIFIIDCRKKESASNKK